MRTSVFREEASADHKVKEYQNILQAGPDLLIGYIAVVLNLSTHSYPLSLHEILSYPLSEGK